MTDWPELLKQLKQDGIRNATVTTIAPTGSISTIADVSSGMEPLYAVAYARRVGDADTFTMNSRFMEMVEDAKLDDSVVEEAKRRGNLAGAKHVPEAIRRLFVTSLEIDPEWHVKMQAAFQKYVDNAVSKTVNMRAESTRDDVANVYLLAHELGCKGITVYRDGSKRDQVLTGGIQRSTYLNALPSANPTGKLPANSYSANTPEGRMYLFVREKDAKPFDIFVILGRAGSDITAFTEAIGRLLSICFRSSIPIDILAENLMGLGGRTSMGFGPERILSVPDAIGKFLEKEYGSESHSHGRRGELCPDCKNASLEYTEGCLKCVICGFSEC
jgi:ribonucleoside-diphosphate reductase alpha chain